MRPLNCYAYLSRYSGAFAFLVLAILSSRVVAQIQFENVTDGSGITYAGESYGGSWGDVNGDAWPDLFVNNHRNRPSLYINNQNGRFTDRSYELDGSGTWVAFPNVDTHGASWSDFDNDGDQDLYVSAGGRETSQFFVNEAGTLINRTVDYDLGLNISARLPMWLDYDRDGLLDFAMLRRGGLTPLFRQTSSGFVERTTATGMLCEEAQRGYLADLAGDDRIDFICVSNIFPTKVYDIGTIPFGDLTSSLPRTGIVLEAAIADFNGDLNSDAFLVRGRMRLSGANQIGTLSIESQLISSSVEKGLSFDSNGTLTVQLATSSKLTTSFIHIGASGWHPTEAIEDLRNITFSLSSSNSSTWGIKDHNPQIDQGIYIGYEPSTETWQLLYSPGGVYNYLHLMIDSTVPVSKLNVTGQETSDLPIAPKLLMNIAGNFQDQTQAAGLSTAISCASTVAADFDNDMDIDLYLVCRDAVSNLANRLYENQGNGTFTRVSSAGGAEGPVGNNTGAGENVVLADYDVDGFMDLFITNGVNLVPEPPRSRGGPDQLFHNLGNANHWIELDLAGTVSNRDGIGAKVYATAGGVTQLREQNGGYHRWAQNHQRIHFGLASNQLVDLEVHWPNGMVDTFSNVDADRLYRVNEGGSIEEIPIGSVSSHLQISDVTVAENAGQASFTVSLSGGSTQTVTVDYATTDGTATANSDYTAVNGGLTFLPGQTAKTVTVPILDDALPEGTEAFTVTLSNASGASIIKATGTGTITDNETSPCGQPPYDKATESAVFIWKDCSDDSWHVRVTAGGQSLNYVGSVDADQPFTSVSPFQLAGADILDYTTDPTRIAFSLFVGGSGHDGFEFTFPAAANVCFGVDTPAGIPVLLGAARIPMTVPFDLNSLGPCTTTPPSPCDQPSYDKATESAVFIWKDCSDDSWHVRVTAGGQSLNYVGTIDADQPFSSVNPFRLAGADILDYTTDPTRIAYSFFVGNAGQDGADFTFPAGATVCFGVDAPAGIPVLLGATRTPMTVPFELNSLGPC